VGEWIRLVKAIGTIRDIRHLTFVCEPGSHDFHPFQAVADAVSTAPSLCKLSLSLEFASYPSDRSGLIALAAALRQHTALQEFYWQDTSWGVEVVDPSALHPS
jgi:hypothetical protein